MYSIIIVEDEVDVRKAIIDIVEWDKLGFRLVGETGNGQEALTLIEEDSPDVIITDIKMPFMGGITLAERVREINPVTKIVFLTGFDDFGYAISAIKLNVIDYLLKPISAQKLTETLISIKEKLDEERQEIRDMERLKEGYNENLDLRKTSFLISMITDEAPAEEDNTFSLQMAYEYGLRLLGERFLLFVLSFDSPSLTDAAVPVDDIEFLKFSVTCSLCTIAEKYLDGEIFIYGSVIVGILSDSAKNLEAYSDILINEIHQSIPHFYGFTATIGVSNPYSDISQTRNAFLAARGAINYRMVLGDGKIIYLSDVEKGQSYVPVFSDTRDTQLRSIIKAGSKDELTAFVDEIFAEMKERTASQESYRICLIEMYGAVLRTLKNVSGSIKGLAGDLAFREDIFGQHHDKQRSWLEGVCHEAMDHIRKQQKTSAGVFVEKGYDYMKKNYAYPDISLKTVSGFLHISASYFSSIFKKETGQSFTDALIEIRMEAARELLLTTGLKIFEIAERAGYSDQHYFSYCFKKYFGKSPGDMRAEQAAD